ncbi:NYN domain-containing protein [Nonomuraea guangzhouensis]|uniref:NYN domain-containing protein n=1 Tax=Nonomuraea guangzhouensis TaxID=1291555 RepID=A0ABW4G491_9ACTN|nr:NYN domain-containing protein [Nonomuraea guangzhouensis]
MATGYGAAATVLNEHSRWIAYIDAANLYYGICETAGPEYWRVDVVRMCDQVLKKYNGTLTKVKYFTTALSGQAGVDQRKFEQDTISVYGQQFQPFMGQAKYDDKTGSFKEKQVDVRLAAQLVGDLCTGGCEAALVVSSDSDLAAAIREARWYAPGKTIVAAHPDGVRSGAYAEVVNEAIPIDAGLYRNAARLDVTLERSRKK